ncbi:hypothetical protein DL96DRAFT_1571868 [Flagelloscypha sp. PMI_526]|nr:hypothetical protein DL96DRAFT_1571868 [Flagelloscypha sp. PMI_526]
MHLDFQRVCRTLDSHIAECSNIHKHLNDPRLSMLDPATHPKAPSLSVLLGSPYDQNTWSVLPVVPTQGAPYVTVQDFVVTIVRYLQAVIPRQAREVWSGELRNVSKDAFSARTRGDLEAFRQGQKMVDIFGDHVVFAGLQPLSNGQLMLRAVKRH